MLEASMSEETKEKQNSGLNNALQVLDELERETNMLYEEKASLLEIEEKLMLKINEEIENKRQKKEQLKKEVEDLKRRCEKLTAFVNTHLQE